MTKNDRFVNFRPLLTVFLGLALGIFAGKLFVFSGGLSAPVFCLVCAAAFSLSMTVCLLKKRGKTPVIALLLSLGLFVAGIFAVPVEYERFSAAPAVNGETVVEGRVAERGKKDEDTFSYVLTDVKFCVSEPFSASSRLTFTARENTAKVGDVVRVTVHVSTRTLDIKDDNELTYLISGSRYVASGFVSEITVLSSSPTPFEWVRGKIEDALATGLQGNAYGMARALLLGETDEMDAAVLGEYRAAGIAHLFAVSGLHIGFLAFALDFLFRKLRLNRLAAGLITAVTVFFYAGVCGFTASSLRAAVMYTVLLFASRLGERYDGLSALAFSGLITLAVMPLQIFSAGFLLSYALTAALLIGVDSVKNRLKRLPQKLSSSLAVAILAFYAGFPLSMKYFGRVSAISWLINLITVPVSSVLFTYLVIATLLSTVFPVGQIVLLPFSYAVEGLSYFVNLLSPESFFIGGFAFGIFALLYYLGGLLFCGFFAVKKRTATWLGLSLILLSVVFAVLL